MLQMREHYVKWNEQKLIFEDRSAELNLSHLPSDSGTVIMGAIGSFSFYFKMQINKKCS
jgi:hypothetical protein